MVATVSHSNEGFSSSTENLVTDEMDSHIKQNGFDPMCNEGGTEMMYYNVNYVMPMKVAGKKIDKVILKDCSGIIKPGVNAIMGPTGSGKSTFLDILAGRKYSKYLSGEILVNGRRQPKDFRLMCGFVVQDDVVFGTLTVRENIEFSASLRLPSSFSKHDRAARVEMIINDLGLQHCCESKIGTDERRGVSGGERKRTSIGMELITNPAALFLDEPTTGLDASTAYSVIELLLRLANKNKTVIFSIHQPRYSIFKMFSSISLLSRGEMVYSGPASQAISYFDSLGYTCDIHNNPGDHLLDIICDEEMRIQGVDLGIEDEDKVETVDKETKLTLTEKFKTSHYFKDPFVQVQAAVTCLINTELSGADTKDVRVGYQSSVFQQIRYVCGRTFINLIRNPTTLKYQVLIKILLAATIGALSWQLATNSAGIQNRNGIFFYLISNMVYTNFSALNLFISERRVFRHECGIGYYRVSAYFIAKVFCDILPLRVIPAIMLSSIVYFMVGLKLAVVNFVVFTLTLCLVALTAAGYFTFISSSVNSVFVANTLVGLPLTVMQLFSGFLMRIVDTPVWMQWLQYFSIFRYGLVTLQINELHEMTFSGCGPYQNETCQTGDAYLISQDLNYKHEWDAVFILIGMTLVFFFLAYIQLRRIKIYT